MKDKPKTAQQWLSLPESERPVALAEVLNDGPPWDHEFHQNTRCCPSEKCAKCGDPQDTMNVYCPVKDPIVIDWNTAMEWVRKSHAMRFEAALIRIFDIVCPDGDYQSWTLFGVTVEELLFAAAMAQDK